MDQPSPRPPDENNGQPRDPFDQHERRGDSQGEVGLEGGPGREDPVGTAGGEPGGSTDDGSGQGLEQGLDPRISEHLSRLLAVEGSRKGAPQPSDVLPAPEPSILTFMRSTHESQASPAVQAGRSPTTAADKPVEGPVEMPVAVAQRIAAALATEARLRVDPGPLRSASAAASTASTASVVPAATPEDPDRVGTTTGFDDAGGANTAESAGRGGSGGAVTPFRRSDRHTGRGSDRRSPWMAVGAVAAAAAVIATGGSLLHLNKRSDATAAINDATSGIRPSTPSSDADAPGPAAPSSPALPDSPDSPALPDSVDSLDSPATAGAAKVHIQLSTTAYAAGNLAQQARELIERPGPELGSGAAEAPSIGPIATPVGLASCLSALPLPGGSGPSTVSVDLANYDAVPAAVVVVTRDAASFAWVVKRSCSQNDPGVLKAATPVP